jgi:hypothetical protein
MLIRTNFVFYYVRDRSFFIRRGWGLVAFAGGHQKK